MNNAEDLRRTVGLDARRFYRKAMHMQSEMDRGVADEDFDRLELMRGMEKASRYAKAVVVRPVLGRGRAGHTPGGTAVRGDPERGTAGQSRTAGGLAPGGDGP